MHWRQLRLCAICLFSWLAGKLRWPGLLSPVLPKAEHHCKLVCLGTYG